MQRAKAIKILIFVPLFLIIIFIIFWFLIISKEKPLKLIMLNIGQGDAIYIQTPNGNNMLIDSGRDRTILYEISNVMPLNKKSIDIIEISNPDLDHIGGFPFIMQKYEIKKILSPGVNHNSLDSYNEIQKIAEQEKIEVLRPKSGTKIILDTKNNVTYTILWPEGNVHEWEVNAGSMVGLLEYHGHKILLTGDAPKEVEDQIIIKYKNSLENIDILKVGHHGSKTSTGENLLKVTNPKYALISAGENNRYGHPHPEVTDRLKKFKVKALTTIDSGQINCNIWIKKETVCK